MNRIEFQPTEEALAFLLTPEGRSLLSKLATADVSEASLLGQTVRLRRDYAPDVVAAALDLALLRHKARLKFTRAGEMFFTRQALEQASAEIVSRYRARRFARYGGVADLCCGIGSDALALATHAQVLAVDIDPIRARMAEANACIYGVGDRLRVECADVTTYSLPEDGAVWADPSRRVEGRRVFSIDDYRPSLSALLRLAQSAPGAGIKLSPGVDYAELDALLGSDPYEIEVISVRGEAREAVLWLGELCTERRRATLLPGQYTLTVHPLTEPVPVTPVRSFLYEPDAAVIRAHLVEHLALSIAATKIDEQIAYLTADSAIETPFATAYRVQEVLPFGLKRINRRLRTMSIGELVIKKRGLGIDPEQFRHRLRYGAGTDKVVLVLTRVRDKPTALICRAVPASPFP